MNGARGFELYDPRPRAKSAPYTFFLPSAAEIMALRPGDNAKVMIARVPPSPKWECERLWTLITERTGECIRAKIDNDPSDIPALKAGDEIEFYDFNVIAIEWDRNRREYPMETRTRQYWERCLVDDFVLNGELPVGYLYREEPDTPEDDIYADSGWRIWGDMRNESDANIDNRTASYVALGAVLNRDDSWLSLIDAPVGSRFIRDFATSRYLEAE